MYSVNTISMGTSSSSVGPQMESSVIIAEATQKSGGSREKEVGWAKIVVKFGWIFQYHFFLFDVIP
jgi:hypothetical protein